ncbi:hypothetical protein [Streptomyces atratus]|uniref:hypothetical protein n=1 Tax=Streptomyces atratus TaxID=1893 RepID=UPI0021A4D18A|nr:hypothetical protein [Streptomyces atratus]MCT2546879.1 hypothetical protein [Streptomyces atratus]
MVDEIREGIRKASKARSDVLSISVCLCCSQTIHCGSPRDKVDHVDTLEIDTEDKRRGVDQKRGGVSPTLLDGSTGRDGAVVFEGDPKPVHPVHRVLAKGCPVTPAGAR